MRISIMIACLMGCGSYLFGQDSLSFGGIYDLPGAEVRADYQPVSPLAQRFTIEEVYRLPGTFYDPARLVALLPGVVQTNDQANHLSVRGNSPNKNLWRLNGLAIVNPNHTANAGTFYDFPALNGGGVNAISAQMLDNSGFYSGILPARYGNATGGTFDLQLRPGSKTSHKQQVQAGFVGFDLAAEGPIGRSKNLSYLINGRYSFTGLLADAGVDFGGEEIRFFDGNFHLHRQGLQSDLSVFAIGGNSSNQFEGPGEGETLESQKDLFSIDYSDYLFVAGATYKFQFLNSSSLSTGLAYSGNGPNRNQQLFSSEPTLYLNLGLTNRLTNGYLTYDRTLNDNFSVEGGIEVNLGRHRTFLRAGEYDPIFDPDISAPSTNFRNISPYAGFTITNGAISVETSIRQNFFNSDFGPSRALTDAKSNVSLTTSIGDFILSSGFQSQSSPASSLFTINDGEVGIIAYQTASINLSFGRQLGKVYTKITGFAQATPDEPAAMVDGFLYSANNLLELDPFLQFDTVANTRRLGLELEVAGGRKDSGLYYRGSVTLLDAKTEQEEETWVDDRFAVGYIGKLTLGREWSGQDRKERARSLGFNVALIAHGGERYGRIEPRFRSPEILNYFQRPNYRDGFTNQLNTYFRPDLRLYKTKTRPKTTTTLALDIQNIAGVENVGSVYYDALLNRPNERYQLGLIPVLSYRIVWR